MNETITSVIKVGGAVDVELGNGAKKTISIRDYASIVSSILEDSTSSSSSSTPIVLPDNVYSIEHDDRGTTLGIYSKETYRDIKHSTLGKMTIAAPNVLLSIRLNKVTGKTDQYSLGDIYWFTTDLPRSSLPAKAPKRPNNSNRIWILPVPNIFDNGTMCLGQNSIPTILYNDWSILNDLTESILWGSAFNNDLGIRSLAESTNIGTWLKILEEKHKNGETFPYNLLRGA